MVDLGKTCQALRLSSSTIRPTRPGTSFAAKALAVVAALAVSSTYTSSVFADVRRQISRPSDRERKVPAFLQKNYYLVKITRSYPNENNRLDLDADDVGYGLGYTFVIRQQYLVSLVAGFHSLRHIPTGDSFSYFTMYNESLRLFRLYHPLYLSFGGRIGYVMPTQSNSLPLKQNKDFENEIMVGGSVGLSYVIGKVALVGGHLAYWGGTNSSKHRIIDFGIDIRMSL